MDWMRWRCFRSTFMLLFATCSFTDCYDPLDPNGNVTVTFDILRWTNDGYVARVSIQNYYQYRQVDKPGWKLGFTWTNNEVIWSLSGAIATHRGNCTTFRDEIPHCCMQIPEIVDLMPDARSSNFPENCCRGGLLAASAINPAQSASSFDIVVGNLKGNFSVNMPENLTLLGPGAGYTCSAVEETQPTVSLVDGGIRDEQVFRTWKSTCTYSSYLANKTPLCCVSLSTFYSPHVTTCPQCSCGCRPANKKTTSCVLSGSSSSELIDVLDAVRCTDHMCPLRVHWHVKNNYVDHWRVKLTVTNLNYNRSYTNWNLVVHHPGFTQPATTYSFNTTLLHTYGISDDVALFWGLDDYNTDYNTELLNADTDQVGSVSTEILLVKDHKTFTLHNGWALPRTIYFAGENCVMPSPDTYPMLPNATSRRTPISRLIIFIIIIHFSSKLLRF